MIMIGIAGPSGGGKTTVTNMICEKLSETTSYQIISHDNYYKDQGEIPFEERIKTNYDHPNAFETDLLISNLKRLKADQVVNIPIYDFNIHTRSKETLEIKPADIVFVEGILTLQDEKLRELFDLKIYVQTDADECLVRRINRDTKERSRSLESIMEQYLKTVKPMLQQFIEPSKKYADVIIPNGELNLKAIDLIANHLNNMI